MSEHLDIREHCGAGYAARTRFNAVSADLTVAFAADFCTAGEKLTRKAAGERYLAISLDMPCIDASRLLYRALRHWGVDILNVAGNGIATLVRHGWSQDSADEHVFDVLATVYHHWPLRRIITGGQTGIDLAGAIAAVALGIDVAITMPPGFLQRHEDGVDRVHSEAAIREDVLTRAARLSPRVPCGVTP